jgi:hypothetical protein
VEGARQQGYDEQGGGDQHEPGDAWCASTLVDHLVVDDKLSVVGLGHNSNIRMPSESVQAA